MSKMKNRILGLAVNILLLYCLMPVSYTQAANSVLLLDDFNDGDMYNDVSNSLSKSFGSLPHGDYPTGSCKASIYSDQNNVYGRTGASLQLSYDVSAVSDSGTGSFSGYCSPLAGYNLSSYNYLSFWVKGEVNNVLFKIELKGTGSPAAVYITDYLDNGVTADWQKVVIPLDAFCNVTNLSQIEEFVIVFEHSSSKANNSPLSGTIYIDDILFGTYFPGCVRIDHYGDKWGPTAVGGNIGDGTHSATISHTFTTTCHNAPNALQIDYDVSTYSSWAFTFSIFGGISDPSQTEPDPPGWQKVPHDFSRYDYLSLWIKAASETENPEGIRLELHDAASGNGEPYYQIPKFSANRVTTSWKNFEL
ncbi:MAG: carbohydrate binding domain-containing protein [Candidatus Desantisbacteria bacterium]